MATGDNAILPLYGDDGDHLTCAVAAGQTISSGRFVIPSGGLQSGPLVNASSTTWDGGNIQVAQATAGQRAFGVSNWDAVNAGDKVGVFARDSGFIVPMTAGAAITAGQEVQSNATGQPIPWDGTIASRPCGQAVSTAASGATVYVRI